METRTQKLLETVFLEHYQEWCLLSFSYLGNRNEAEDVVQDVLVKLLQRKKKSPIINLKAYISVSVRNVSLKRIKRLKKTVFLRDADTPVASVESDLILAETSAMMFRIVESLPEQRKKVFKLCVLDGLKYKSAAQTLGISTNTVKYHMKKSFKTLRFSFQNTFTSFFVFTYLFH